jgi:phage FluMu protein Com
MFGKKDVGVTVKCQHCKKSMSPEQIQGYLVQHGNFVVFSCPHCQVILHLQAKDNVNK